MTEAESANIALIRDYLAAIESGEIGNATRFFTPAIRQIELPNKLNPNGGESDLPTMLERAEQGKKVIRQQKYAIVTALAQGDRVALEARWEGVLAIPFGSLDAGATMVAHFAMFFEFVNGRIRLQRNYDCFEPW